MAESSFQDDQRENAMIELFGLEKDHSEGRSGVDAYLTIGTSRIAFELKTSSDTSVTTVRDFGPEHIRKWRDKHWLFAFYRGGKIHYQYASPEIMKPWIDEKESYIALDFALADLLSEKLVISDVHSLVGSKDVYSLDDARFVQKRQLSAAQYRALQDHPSGYSPERMLQIVQQRAKYLVSRGSTLNNPHIPGGFFEKLPKIEKDHAAELRHAVSLAIGAIESDAKIA